MLVQRDALSSVICGSMELDTYLEVREERVHRPGIRKYYLDVVSTIARQTGDDDLAKVLKIARGKAVSSINCTIKSHKPAGNVVPRSLHGSTGHMYEALARWVVLTIRPALSTYNHLHASTLETSC